MTTTDESVKDESTETTETEEVETGQVETETEEAKPDPNEGQRKALIAERTARKASDKRVKELEAAAADKDKPAEEQALENARREAREEVTGKANERIVRSEVKAAATGKVKNPALALKLIDMSEIDVDDDGEVDSDAVASAIADLLEQYPELAADSSKFSGSADQGAKGKQANLSQLTAQDLESMSDEAINKARREGRLKKLFGGN